MKAVRAMDPYFVAQYIPYTSSTQPDCGSNTSTRAPSANLLRVFINHFNGAYTKAGSAWELMGCERNKGESLWDYVKRFACKKNELHNIPENKVVDEFMSGIKDEQASFRRSGESRSQAPIRCSSLPTSMLMGMMLSMPAMASTSRKLKKRLKKKDRKRKCNFVGMVDKGSGKQNEADRSKTSSIPRDDEMAIPPPCMGIL